MQVNMIPETPEEIRFVANCLLGLADLREAAGDQPIAVPAPAPAADKKPRRTAEKKTEPAAEPTKQLTAAEAKDGAATQGESAGTAQAAEESGKPQADAPATEATVVTHDMLRAAFGAIADAAKRAEVVKGIEKLGFTSIKGISEDKLADAYKLMVG